MKNSPARQAIVAMLPTAVVRIMVVALGVLAARACLPEATPIADAAPTNLARKLIIVPTEGVPGLFTGTLKTRLEQRHGFGVTTTVQIPFPVDAHIPGSSQFSGAKIAEAGLAVCRTMAQANEYCVVLTNRDINEQDSGLRFFFAQHYSGISVVSTARMNDLNFGGGPDLISTPLVFEKVQSRVTKMINKGLGLGHYGYGLSNDKASVMYAPVMGLDDLDAMGDWYTGKEVKQKNF